LLNRSNLTKGGRDALEFTVKKEVVGSSIILQLNGMLDITTTNLIDPYLEKSLKRLKH
jgi:hypothetical protein